MAVRTLALCSAVLVATLASAQAGVKWESFAPKGYRFSILMPIKPVAQPQRVDEDQGKKFKTQIWVASNGPQKVSCVASVTTLPAGTSAEILHQMKIGIKAGMLQSLGGTKQSEVAATYSGIKGSKMMFETDGGEGTVWIGQTKNQLITLSIAMRGKRVPAMENKFFGSFKKK